jgi:hypothetical protein
MNSYANRFAVAMAPLLPDDVEVIEASGLIVIQRGTANIAMWPPSTPDKRAAVSFEQARTLIRDAAARLAGEIPKYREVFRPPARELVEILRTAAADPNEDEATTGATPAVVEPPRITSRAAAAERLADHVAELLSVLDRKHQHHDEVSAALALYRGAPE